MIALGSNLRLGGRGPRASLKCAVAAIAARIGRVQARSALYGSTAWPDPQDPAFLNAALLVRTKLSPREVLRRLHAIEASLGRRRGGARNAPRSIDLDLIWSPTETARSQARHGLMLPHPRARGRAFVLAPWRDVTPGAPPLRRAGMTTLIENALDRRELWRISRVW